MPSPIGHALGGIALAWAASPRRNWQAAAVLAGAALAPDLDLLVGDHRGISHSTGAALVVGGIAWAACALSRTGAKRGRRGSGPSAARWAVAISLAWASHVALDWLSNDTRPPIGVMALWPLTRDYYKAAFEIFPPVSRRFGDARFWTHNVRAAVVELAILTPLMVLALRSLKRR